MMKKFKCVIIAYKFPEYQAKIVHKEKIGLQQSKITNHSIITEKFSMYAFAILVQMIFMKRIMKKFYMRMQFLRFLNIIIPKSMMILRIMQVFFKKHAVMKKNVHIVWKTKKKFQSLQSISERWQRNMNLINKNQNEKFFH